MFYCQINNTMMQAVVLVAGRGTRMRPLTLKTPKPLLKVCGIPILQWNLDQLNNLVKDVVVIVGYKGDMIRKYFGTTYKNLALRYVHQGDLLGTGHAAKKALPFLRGRFLLMYGDDIHHARDIKRLLKKFPAVLVHEVDDPKKFGVVSVENGFVTNLIEKPKRPIGNLVNTGLYFLDVSVFQPSLHKSKRGEYEFTDYIKAWIKKKKIHAVITDLWMPIAFPEDLKKAEALLND
jgi:UDP-N-acetylglucosamine diphosphorylase / glucose-1-phosphate thymidylyltransferase / UDP-N-acetylgalactosamine diphosphorylase / glucosamine-1-phosphate N-acetyltransferase / galactosamine-1-phosphate N-acetyltransferase